MTYKENIKAILECYFTGFKEEIIDSACNRILEQELCGDVLSLTKQVVTQVTEDIDNFIFTTIRPWCEEKEQRKISKRDLEQALTQYFGKLCPKTKKWIEERTYIECPHCHDIWHYEKNQTERFKCCPTCGERFK